MIYHKPHMNCSEINCQSYSAYIRVQKKWTKAGEYNSKCRTFTTSEDVKMYDEIQRIAFKKSLTGISSKTLSTRLSELVSEGILERETFAEIPPRVEYRLTQKGQELIESITDLLNWMRKWSKK